MKTGGSEELEIKTTQKTGGSLVSETENYHCLQKAVATQRRYGSRILTIARAVACGRFTSCYLAHRSNNTEKILGHQNLSVPTFK